MQSVLHGVVFLGDLIVPLPAAVSRSLPPVASHAIGFAEPRHGIRSPGFGACGEDGQKQGPVSAEPIVQTRATTNSDGNG